MGSIKKKAESAVNVASLGTYGMAKGMINPDMPKAPEMQAPKPVAPATQQSDNVQQAKDYARRKSSNMQGRSSSNLLDPAEAKEDKQKDLLG